MIKIIRSVKGKSEPGSRLRNAGLKLVGEDNILQQVLLAKLKTEKVAFNEFQIRIKSRRQVGLIMGKTEE